MRRAPSLPHLRRYPDGGHRCIGCGLCQALCPVAAISLEWTGALDRPKLTRCDIDVSRCIGCGQCEEACPVQALGGPELRDEP